MNALDDMLNAYVACALWSTPTCDPDGNLGEYLDSTDYDLAPETLEAMRADCEAFYRDEYTDDVRLHWTPSDFGHDFGHDFWLTREHHGVGFWDRGAGPIGERLTQAAHVYGGFDLYVGDDGLIHGG